MPLHEYEKPWQVMPAKIIKLALEHAEKKDDFDHQIAFLLLDIGVEAALKTYLVNKGHDVEKMHFPELLRKVREELSKTKPNLIGQVDDVRYYHGIRNKLYHQGDGVKPTGDNLKRYSDLARKIIEDVIEVNLKTDEKKYVIEVQRYEHELEDLIDAIEKRFAYFRESCAVIAEKTRPIYATREFAMKLKYILTRWGDDEDSDPEDRIENRKLRVEKFNDLTGKRFEDYSFVDWLLDDVNHLYVLIAFQQVSGKKGEEWKEYLNLDKRRSRLLSDWKSDIQSKRLTQEQIVEEFEKIIGWLESKQAMLDEWIDNHMENIARKGRELDPLDFHFDF